MTLLEFLTLATAVVSLIIGAISLVRTRKLAAEQLRLDGIMADLAKKQLEQIEAEEHENKLPSFNVSLNKLGKNYNLLIVNRGNGSANNLNLELVDCADSPLYGMDGKFPWPELRPGQRIKLGAAIHMQSPNKYLVRLSYTDADGQTRTEDHHVAL